MTLSLRKTYTLICLCIFLFQGISIAQISESSFNTNLSPTDDLGVRSFEVSDVIEKSFLRDSTRTYEFNNEASQVSWELVSSESFTYDEFGKEISKISKIINGDLYRNDMRWDNFYGLGAEVVEQNESVWSPISEDWSPTYKRQYSYNHRGQELDIFGYAYVDDMWEPDSRTSFDYNQDDNVSEETVYEWDNESGLWQEHIRTLFTYNNRASILSEVNQIWNDSLMQWENSFSRLFEYNSENQVTSTVRRDWDESVQGWKNISVLSLMYNDKGQVSSSQRDYVDAENSLSQPEHSESATYSEEGNLGELVHSVWNENSGTWDTYQKEVHFWSEYVQGNLDETEREIDCLFANPYLLGLPWFCDNLKSDVNYIVEVYDQWGRLFFQDNIQSKATFRLNGNIPPGMYNVIVRGGLDYHTEKVLIRN